MTCFKVPPPQSRAELSSAVNHDVELERTPLCYDLPESAETVFENVSLTRFPFANIEGACGLNCCQPPGGIHDVLASLLGALMSLSAGS